MKRWILFFCLLPFFYGAQILSEKSFQNWEDSCNALLSDEKYPELIKKASEALEKTKDPKQVARFQFFKAYGFEYWNNQYEKAIPYYEEALKNADKSKNLRIQTDALMRLNYLYFSTKQFDRRENQIKTIKSIADTTKSIYSKAIMNGSLGEYYLDKSEMENFIHYSLKAIEYRKKFPKSDKANQENICILYIQIAGAYFDIEQYKKGIEYLNQANYYPTEKTKYAQSFIYYNYVQGYAELKEEDSIRKYYNALQKIVTSEEPNYIPNSAANRYFSEFYIGKNDIQKAEFYAKKAIELAEKSNDEEIMMEARIAEAKVLQVKKKFKESNQLLLLASKHAYEFDKNSYSLINQMLSANYAELNDWKNAYHYQNEYSKVNEELLKEGAKQAMVNAEAKFQNNSKQEKINLLSTENKLKNLEINSTRKQLLFIFIAALLLGMVGILLYRQSESRKKTNQKLQILNKELDEANKVKTRFFSILNHDLRSPVANLIHFLHLQKENPELFDEETKKRFESKTIEGAENLLSSMEDILLWSKGQMENFKPHPQNIKIETLFEDNKKVFSGYQNIHFQYENPNDISVFTDENYLKTIIRNLTSNAINIFTSTENPTIIWKAWQENGISYLSVSDNGSGAEMEKFRALYDENEVVGIKTGLGLHLIRDLAKAIGCKISVDSVVGSGTTFTLSF